MFHQVQIRKADRAAQRFLWRDLECFRAPDVYEMKVMTFGATCSPVCAQFVKNLNAEEVAVDPMVLKAVTTKFYVDDYLDSKDTIDEALYTIHEVRKTLKLGGFDLVNWMTNSTIIRHDLSEDVLATSKNLEEENIHRVLGMWWDSNNDTFFFKLNENKQQPEGKPTKRNVLKTVMALFDPLGLITCFSVKGRILMQEIWRTGCNWDEEIPENLKCMWTKWIEDLKKVTNIAIPRCYSENIPVAKKIELHIFCDSSEKAYAAVAYLRIITPRQIDISLVAAKSRVSPLKPLSIPRLELQGSVLASRLGSTLLEELEIPIHKTYFWTDSKCVLNWIRNDGRKFKQFIAVRIGEIQELTTKEDWRWVPTLYNAADLATRFSDSHQSQVIPETWLKGPAFLKEQEEYWPKEQEDKELELDEVKKEYAPVLTIATSQRDTLLPDISRFSKWLRLIRSTAWFNRYIGKLKKKSFPSELTVSELNEAEKKWIQFSQWKSFSDEIQLLGKGKPIPRKSHIRSLNPEMQDGLLVLKGRTDLSNDLGDETKRPIILSPKCSYTKLLIKHFHEKNNHFGVELVLNQLRQKYWIVNGRSAVKTVFSRCQLCRNNKVKPKIPLMGQIPLTRVTREVRPFTNTGMDYFGPILVTVGRRKEKRWGIIFTCLSVRAIHLEVAHTLNTDSTLMALRRFVARRGIPKTITCDNGTNLKAAAKEIGGNIDETEVIDALTTKGISVQFNPPGGAHFGGAWERLIGTVKKVIGKILYEQSIKDEVLLTLLIEAENIVNSRPLTKVSTDPEDLEVLTPNNFLLGANNRDTSFTSNPNSKCLRQDWKRSQMLTDMFWTRWVKEYLPTLTRRNKWISDNKSLEINDVVTIVDENAPRYSWKLGKIEAVYPGPDGRIRVVDVKTSTGLLRRPVSKLCRLEFDE